MGYGYYISPWCLYSCSQWIKPSINKDLSSAHYDSNLSSLLRKARNYLCIRNRDRILDIVYLNCFSHAKKKQAIVDEYPLCPRDVGTNSAFRSYTRLIQKGWQNHLYPAQPAQVRCKLMKVAVGWEAHQGWITNTTARFNNTPTYSWYWRTSKPKVTRIINSALNDWGAVTALNLGRPG